ncbi:unnamed protein product [Vitrella brassicaformis CCMP3155]|uniref:Uncharacterized protein n=1 Tax=Vitrella brassicaformis (strain CCMP3155) TaxID=1169540 RepID=A0A0G4END4_VITBC|nr:unnamed protein product [Vitrella brassicaformis CCMP3155]|eukprot:CEL98819.1 unnamed protein product [Vitrella brassicaformis CCMP3155]
MDKIPGAMREQRLFGVVPEREGSLHLPRPAAKRPRAPGRLKRPFKPQSPTSADQGNGRFNGLTSDVRRRHLRTRALEPQKDSREGESRGRKDKGGVASLQQKKGVTAVVRHGRVGVEADRSKNEPETPAVTVLKVHLDTALHRLIPRNRNVTTAAAPAPPSTSPPSSPAHSPPASPRHTLTREDIATAAPTAAAVTADVCTPTAPSPSSPSPVPLALAPQRPGSREESGGGRVSYSRYLGQMKGGEGEAKTFRELVSPRGKTRQVVPLVRMPQPVSAARMRVSPCLSSARKSPKSPKSPTTFRTVDVQTDTWMDDHNHDHEHPAIPPHPAETHTRRGGDSSPRRSVASSVVTASSLHFPVRTFLPSIWQRTQKEQQEGKGGGAGDGEEGCPLPHQFVDRDGFARARRKNGMGRTGLLFYLPVTIARRLPREWQADWRAREQKRWRF